MTRRERMERRAELRREWAHKRAARSAAAAETARRIVDGIPLGQPILVGHHSERRHRRAIDRMGRAMSDAVESSNMAAQHVSKAASIEDALSKTIFSDDADSADRLRDRIAERERRLARMKLVNKAHARYAKTGTMPEGLTDSEAAMVRVYEAQYSWEPHPYPPYSLANLRNLISADKKRLSLIAVRSERTAAAEAAPGGVVIDGTDYVRLTFAEKPHRQTIDALKSAGFRWSGGAWYGRRDKLPPIPGADAASS